MPTSAAMSLRRMVGSVAIASSTWAWLVTNRHACWLVEDVFRAGTFSGERRLVERCDEDCEQLADRHQEARGLHGHATVDLIPVTTSDPRLREIPGSAELADDLSGPSLGDPDPVGEVPQACIPIHRDVREHVTVIGHEAPLGICLSGT